MSSSKARLKNLSRKTETDRYKHGRKTNTVTHTSKRPAPVQKKILSASSYPGLAAQPCCHSKQNPEIRLAQGSHDQLSGPTRVTQDEHAQQHSSPLTCTQAAASSSLPSSGQVKKSTIFNCRLTTSTPALSPQRPRSAHSEPCTSNCAQSNSSSGEFHHITQQWAMNAAVPSCSHGSVGTTITPTQCAASVSMAPALQLQPPVTVLSSEQNGPGSPAGQGVPLNGGPICGVSNVGPLGHSVSFPLSTGSLTCPSTSALATQAHIAHPLPDPNRPLLLCSSTQGQEICSGQSSQESGGRTSAEEEEEQVDTTPVRDISCQISQEICTGLSHKATPTSSEKTARKVMTVRYLLGELKTLVANQDSEAVRLISEVEQSISLLPVMVGSTNIQAEIALALQPLRSENVQLRRRLRILNQQLLERERAERRARPADCNMEVDALQSMNLTLQTQLNESHKKFEDLLQENMRLRKAIEDKESDLQKNKKQCELENSQLKQEASEALAEMRLCQSKLSELEIERSALILSLQEREAEISRLHEVIRNLQSCQTKEITESSLRLDLSQPNSQLTKSILELHENAQKESSASDKVSDTVKTYLQTLKGIGQASPPHRLHYRPQTFPPTSPGQESSIPSVSKVCSPKVTDKHKATLETIAENVPQLIEPRGITFAPLREIPVMSNVSKSLTRYNEMITSKSQKESLDEDLGLKYMGRAFEKLGISDEAHTQNHLSDHHGVASQLNETNKGQDHPLQSQHARRCLRMDVESAYTGRPSAMENTLTSCDIKSDCSVNSWSTFNTRDEQNFRDGLAALDASIASLQRTLKADLNK